MFIYFRGGVACCGDFKVYFKVYNCFGFTGWFADLFFGLGSTDCLSIVWRSRIARRDSSFISTYFYQILI